MPVHATEDAELGVVSTPSVAVREATAVATIIRGMADDRLTRVVTLDDTVALPAFDSLPPWRARRSELRQQILAAAGLLPEPPRSPLTIQVTGRHERDGYAVENIAFQSKPGYYVTGNLYLPAGKHGPLPAILNPHGHTIKGRLEHGANNSTQARCITFARMGYIAFAYDMNGYNDSTHTPHRFHAFSDALWSFGSLHLQLWNSMRCVDFLLSRADVDPNKLGCTGESGGATQTLLLAAVDDRVRYVAPAVMVSAHYQGGCICENAPNLRLGTSNVEIAAMAAPRPMLLVSATRDWTCNTPTVEYPAIKAIYALYGAAGNVFETQVDAPHNLNQPSREALYRFFSHCFDGTPLDQPYPEQPIVPAQDSTLRVFPDGLPAGALTLSGLRSSMAEFAQAQVEANWPYDVKTHQRFRSRWLDPYRLALDATPVRSGDITVHRVSVAAFGDERAACVQLSRFPAVPSERPRQEGLPALFFAGSAGLPVILLHHGGKAAYFQEHDGAAVPGSLLAALLRAQRPVLMIDAFLTGEYGLPPGARGRDLASPHFTTFNRTDAVLRVQDVMTAVAAARQLASAPACSVLALGDAGPWAILARPLCDGVSTLCASAAGMDWAGDTDYLNRLYIPGIRRFGGMRTALALAAPAATHVWDATGSTTAPVASLYSGLGAGDAFSLLDQAPSISELLARL